MKQFYLKESFSEWFTLKISLEYLGKNEDLSCGSLNYKNKVKEVDPNLLIICANIVHMGKNYYVYLNYKKPRNLKMWKFQKDSAILAVVEVEHKVN